MTRSGSGTTKLPMCDYFIELSFLRDIVTGRKTETNVPTETITHSPPPLSQDSVTTVINTPSSNCSSDAKSSKNYRKRRSDQIDELLAISLSNDLRNDKKAIHNSDEIQDEDVLFCSSLVKTFQGLKGKQNKRAKVKVLQLLLEFEDDEN